MTGVEVQVQHSA